MTDRPQLVELAKVWRGAAHVARAAAAIAIVAPDPQDDRQAAVLHYDLGQATFAMMVAAADLGIGTGHAAVADQSQARAVLGFPEGRFLAYVLSVGYPSDKPLAVIRRLDRRPFDDVVHTAGRGDPPGPVRATSFGVCALPRCPSSVFRLHTDLYRGRIGGREVGPVYQTAIGVA